MNQFYMKVSVRYCLCHFFNTILLLELCIFIFSVFAMGFSYALRGKEKKDLISAWERADGFCKRHLSIRLFFVLALLAAALLIMNLMATGDVFSFAYWKASFGGRLEGIRDIALCIIAPITPVSVLILFIITADAAERFMEKHEVSVESSARVLLLLFSISSFLQYLLTFDEFLDFLMRY